MAAVLRPHFKALGLHLADDLTVTPLERGAILTGQSKDGTVVASTIEDLAAQMEAAEKLLDRIYGRPKQSTELAVDLTLDDKRIQGEIDAEFRKLMEARDRNLLSSGTP